MEQIFEVRELGCYLDGGDCERYSFDIGIPFSRLNITDKNLANYVMKNIHGLNYEPSRHEYDVTRPMVMKQEQLHALVYALYTRAKNKSDGYKDVVAYNGGSIEKKLFNRLGIKCFNLEEINCPKFSRQLVAPASGSDIIVPKKMTNRLGNKCFNLEEINCPKFIELENKCFNLEEINCPKFSRQRVAPASGGDIIVPKKMTNRLGNKCFNLEEINCPKFIELENKCFNLKEINCPKFSRQRVAPASGGDIIVPKKMT